MKGGVGDGNGTQQCAVNQKGQSSIFCMLIQFMKREMCVHGHGHALSGSLVFYILNCLLRQGARIDVICEIGLAFQLSAKTQASRTKSGSN